MFILESLCIQLITLKSEYIHRIPCRLHMSTVHHSSERVSQARTSYLGDLVEKAREYIYKSGYSVTAAGIERMLKPFSLMPTTVRLAT